MKVFYNNNLIEVYFRVSVFDRYGVGDESITANFSIVRGLFEHSSLEKSIAEMKKKIDSKYNYLSIDWRNIEVVMYVSTKDDSTFFLDNISEIHEEVMNEYRDSLKDYILKEYVDYSDISSINSYNISRESEVFGYIPRGHNPIVYNFGKLFKDKED